MKCRIMVLNYRDGRKERVETQDNPYELFVSEQRKRGVFSITFKFIVSNGDQLQEVELATVYLR